jgi:hypothetical protein
MNDDVNKQKSTTKPDPFYGDELDVLEALSILEKKYGKKLLTEAQEEKLLFSRNKKSNEVKKARGTKNSDDLVKYVLEEALVDYLVKEKYYTREQWGAKTEIQKVHLLDMYCFGLLGMELREWIQQVKNKLGS